MRPLAVPAILLLTVLAAAAPVAEVEPNGFTTPSPQDLGVLGAAGLQVTGALDPTSPTGLDPGDRDGFSFTMEADGAVSATVDDGGAGKVFVLALSREEAGGPVQIAAVTGPAPLNLSRPGLVTGTTYRIGVAALSDGAPLPYTLDVLPENALPPWTGAPCPGAVPEAEPDGDAATATDLGDFTGILCGEGDLAEVAPPGSGLPGDPDVFRFRQVLQVPVRIVISADPGTVRVTLHALSFVGLAPVAEKAFGAYSEIDVGTLQPGQTYYVEIRAEQGTAPVGYQFHLEPIAPPPPPPPQPLDLYRTRVRTFPGFQFRVLGQFAPGLGAGLADGVPFSYRVRGLEEAFGAGSLRMIRGGRLRYRAPRGVLGLRSITFDPGLGRVLLKGRGVDLNGILDPTDPMLPVDLEFEGGLHLTAAEEGEFNLTGVVLRVP